MPQQVEMAVTPGSNLDALLRGLSRPDRRLLLAGVAAASRGVSTRRQARLDRRVHARLRELGLEPR